MDNFWHIADAGFLIGQTTVGLHCVRATLKSPIRHQTFLAANPLRLAVARRQARHPPIWGHSGSESSPGWSCFNDPKNHSKNPSASHRTTGKPKPPSIWFHLNGYEWAKFRPSVSFRSRRASLISCHKDNCDSSQRLVAANLALSVLL